jgi:uncharacterized membrane protein
VQALFAGRNCRRLFKKNCIGGVMELLIVLYFLFIGFWWSGLQESEVV